MRLLVGFWGRMLLGKLLKSVCLLGISLVGCVSDKYVFLVRTLGLSGGLSPCFLLGWPAIPVAQGPGPLREGGG